MRRAKIVCTLGPSTNSPERLHDLVAAGMDIARLNLSHGSYDDHAAVYAAVRRASDVTGRAVGILVDLQGPKIRTTRFSGGPVALVNGDRFTITTREVDGSQHLVGTTYKGLAGDVHPGDTLLIDDGKVELVAVEVTDTDVVCEVVVAGTVSNNKGINLPGVAVSVPALSEKDEADLRWALHLRADWIALSFVRSAEDIDRVHEIMDEEGIRLPVIAKIEKPQAVANLEEIVEAFDGIMVARGDLGVELPLEQVPLVQKLAIEIARRNAKPVIVATQVLESMIENPRPTRAEASDAANAVLDGADALMLSGETSMGAFPIEAVTTMARIIENTEDQGFDRIAPLTYPAQTVSGAITRAAADIGDRRLGAGACPVAAGQAHVGVHAMARNALATRADLGRGDIPGAECAAYGRHGPAGRPGPAGPRPLPRGRSCGDRRGVAPRRRRNDKCVAGARGWRRGRPDGRLRKQRRLRRAAADPDAVPPAQRVCCTLPSRGGGMADTAHSKCVAARRAGSSPALGTPIDTQVGGRVTTLGEDVHDEVGDGSWRHREPGRGRRGRGAHPPRPRRAARRGGL